MTARLAILSGTDSRAISRGGSFEAASPWAPAAASGIKATRHASQVSPRRSTRHAPDALLPNRCAEGLMNTPDPASPRAGREPRDEPVGHRAIDDLERAAAALVRVHAAGRDVEPPAAHDQRAGSYLRLHDAVRHQVLELDQHV